LHWTVLLRPEASREPVPQRWVEQGWRAPIASPGHIVGEEKQ
jgi:putative spermidine/putrescine transport system substrate-binding protein